MTLNEDDVREFKELYEREFGETITDGQAREMAQRVMRLYELLGKKHKGTH